jgi:hypothetical protein
MTKVPVPWSLAWREDGELAAQDRFDLLQNLISSETLDVQSALIGSMERLSSAELSVLSCTDLTGLCA